MQLLSTTYEAVGGGPASMFHQVSVNKIEKLGISLIKLVIFFTKKGKTKHSSGSKCKKP